MHSAEDKSTFCALLVDPDANFRQAVSDILYVYFPCIYVEEAVSGSEALIKVDYLRPNMIFMATPLLGERGLVLAKEIKEVCSNIAIVMLTANDLPEHTQQALESSADYFISKASDGCIREILMRIEEATGGRSFWPGLPPQHS